jgi:hypothetical protein
MRYSRVLHAMARYSADLYSYLLLDGLTGIGQYPFPHKGGRTGWGERSAAFTPTLINGEGFVRSVLEDQLP